MLRCDILSTTEMGYRCVIGIKYQRDRMQLHASQSAAKNYACKRASVPRIDVVGKGKEVKATAGGCLHGR